MLIFLFNSKRNNALGIINYENTVLRMTKSTKLLWFKFSFFFTIVDGKVKMESLGIIWNIPVVKSSTFLFSQLPHMGFLLLDFSSFHSKQEREDFGFEISWQRIELLIFVKPINHLFTYLLTKNKKTCALTSFWIFLLLNQPIVNSI